MHRLIQQATLTMSDCAHTHWEHNNQSILLNNDWFIALHLNYSGSSHMAQQNEDNAGASSLGVMVLSGLSSFHGLHLTFVGLRNIQHSHFNSLSASCCQYLPWNYFKIDNFLQAKNSPYRNCEGESHVTYSL
jgi:hypothetical protein